MRYRVLALHALPLLAILVGGCIVRQAPSEPDPPTPPAPTPPQQMTIQLSNWSNFDVRPQFYRSATAATEEELFDARNLVTDFTDRSFPELRPGEAVALRYDCDLVASIGVLDPVFFDSTNLIRHEAQDSAFLLQGENYECENTIKFVFFRQNGVYQVRAERP